MARAPYFGSVAFDIYGNEVKGNERFMEAAFGEIQRLAERLGAAAPERHEHHRHLSLTWPIGGVSARRLLQGLAELFDSTEFAEAILEHGRRTT